MICPQQYRAAEALCVQGAVRALTMEEKQRKLCRKGKTRQV